MISIKRSDDEIEITIGNFQIAHFEDNGNGMEGEIFEGDNSRMGASELIEIARFILAKAAERADAHEATDKKGQP